MPRELKELPEVRCVTVDGQPDHWARLGVARGADLHAVTKAFRKLAARLHPDKHHNGDEEEANRRYQLVSEAYTVLSTPELLTEYLAGAASAREARAQQEWQEYFAQLREVLRRTPATSGVGGWITLLSGTHFGRTLCVVGEAAKSWRLDPGARRKGQGEPVVAVAKQLEGREWRWSHAPGGELLGARGAAWAAPAPAPAPAATDGDGWYEEYVPVALRERRIGSDLRARTWEEWEAHFCGGAEGIAMWDAAPVVPPPAAAPPPLQPHQQVGCAAAAAATVATEGAPPPPPPPARPPPPAGAAKRRHCDADDLPPPPPQAARPPPPPPRRPRGDQQDSRL